MGSDKVRASLTRRILFSLLLGASLVSAAAVHADTSSVGTGIILRFRPATQNPGNIQGLEVLPKSGVTQQGDAGVRVHTNLHILVPTSGQDTTPVSHAQVMRNLQLRLNPGVNSNGQSLPAVSANTPASVACIYNLVTQPGDQPSGCNPQYTSVNPAGGGGAIALVDAYHYANAASDLAYFSRLFNLPQADFHVVYASTTAPYTNGTQPPVDADWNLEEALDIEWAHSMAPSAKIYLVEAQDSSLTSLGYAILAAQNLVAAAGGGEISMSFGTDDYSGEASFDPVFSNAPNTVVHVAASGDVGSVVSYPAASPYVVGVGGTSVNRDGNGNFTTETAWSDSGGGVSLYESRPSFQDDTSVQAIVSDKRGTPDVSMIADPATGVAVYLNGTWYVVGGTSLATPVMAGLLNVAAKNAGTFPDQSTTIATLYSNGSSNTQSRDITQAMCGTNSALAGYDLCTGWGSPISYPYIAGGQQCHESHSTTIMRGIDIRKYCATYFSAHADGLRSSHSVYTIH